MINDLCKIISSLINLILIVPIAALFIYIAAGFFQSSFGGHMWIWVTSLTLLSLILAKDKLNEAKEKLEKANQS